MMIITWEAGVGTSAHSKYSVNLGLIVSKGTTEQSSSWFPIPRGKQIFIFPIFLEADTNR